MIIIKSLEEIHGKFDNAVVTIGNFDGVHLGHREIFRRVKKSAADMNGVSVVITFIPHPLKLLPSRKNIRLITTYAEKERLIRASGLDCLVMIPFTHEIASITATEFVRQILVGKIGLKKLIIGYDYAFGRDREGNVALLRQLSTDLGFEVEVLEPIGNGDLVYSSSAIREMVGRGEVREVISLLGRNYSLAGVVVHGHHRGKGIGFPTANLETETELIPKSGVYAVRVEIAGKLYDGACNIGTNPTFGDGTTSIEVFIFDFHGELYGRELRLYFIERIRDERKFPDVSSLQDAINKDVATCRDILKNGSLIEFRES